MKAVVGVRDEGVAPWGCVESKDEDSVLGAAFIDGEDGGGSNRAGARVTCGSGVDG